MQKKEKRLETQKQNQNLLDFLESEVHTPDNSKVNLLIKKFANAMRDAGIPNCIMAWDAEKSRYVYAGAMPEEIGDGTQFSSKDLNRFVRFLELCTDFDKKDYRFDL